MLRALIALPFLAAVASALTFSGESLRDGKRVLAGHAAGVNSVAFSPGGLTLASAGQDHTVRLWDLASLRSRAGLSGPRNFWAVAFTRNGKDVVAAGDDGMIRLWDARSGEESAQLPTGKQPVWTLAVSPDGRWLAAGGEDRLVRLYDLKRRRPKLRAVLSGSQGTVASVAFSPDSKLLAAGGADWRVRLWEVPSGKSLGFFKGHYDWVWSVAFSPDGRKVASGGNDGRVKVWDLAANREVMELKGRAARVLSIAFSPDGRFLAAGSYDLVVLWDLKRGRELKAFTDHDDWVRSVAFSADGRYLASGSEDSTVRLYAMDAVRAELAVPRPLAPAKLIVQASRSGDTVLVSVSNTGQGPAYAVRIVLDGDEELEVGNIMPGRTMNKRIKRPGLSRLSVREGNGFDAPIVKVP